MFLEAGLRPGRPNCEQIPITKFQTKLFHSFEIGIWNLFGIWKLEFEVAERLDCQER
jgi:hypothetical protein